MEDTTQFKTLGARMVRAAWLAVAIHLDLANHSDQTGGQTLQQQAMVGGADRFVTDDSQHLVAGRD